MKMKSLILIFIALGCGLVASIGISQVMSQGGGEAKVEMDQILVAKAAIDSGKKLDANMVQFEEWPKQRIPDGALRKIEEIEGKFSSVRFFKGEPILQVKISDKLGGVVGIIPPGYRVTPIKVDEDSVMEAVTPGDTVDVNVFLEAGRGGNRSVGVYTILRNVRVFAKGGQTERSIDDSGKEVRARTVSLLVKPEQSRELVLAYRLGKISLALRPPNAANDDGEDTVTSMDEILQAKGTDATNSSPDSGSGIGDGSAFPFLGNSGPSPNDLASQGKRLQIYTPRGGSEFLFPEDGGAPRETVLYGSGASTSPAPQEPSKAPAAGGNPQPENTPAPAGLE